MRGRTANLRFFSFVILLGTMDLAGLILLRDWWTLFLFGLILTTGAAALTLAAQNQRLKKRIDTLERYPDN